MMILVIVVIVELYVCLLSRSVIAYETTTKPMFSFESLNSAGLSPSNILGYYLTQIYIVKHYPFLHFLFKSNVLILLPIVSSPETLSIYDDVDADIMRNYQEFTLSSMLFFGMKEQSCSEQSARMTAMDGASKNAGMLNKSGLYHQSFEGKKCLKDLNHCLTVSHFQYVYFFLAGEMIDKLTLTFNRTRQAVITRELIEIMSGAAALE